MNKVNKINKLAQLNIINTNTMSFPHIELNAFLNTNKHGKLGIVSGVSRKEGNSI